MPASPFGWAFACLVAGIKILLICLCHWQVAEVQCAVAGTVLEIEGLFGFWYVIVQLIEDSDASVLFAGPQFIDIAQCICMVVDPIGIAIIRPCPNSHRVIGVSRLVWNRDTFLAENGAKDLCRLESDLDDPNIIKLFGCLDRAGVDDEKVH